MSCYSDVPLPAVDPAQYHGGLRRACSLHEPGLVARLSSLRSKCEWGRGGLRPLQAISGSLQSLPSDRDTGGGGHLWTVRSNIWRGGQRLLADDYVVPVSGDLSAGLCGLYLHFQLVLSEYPEEEHLQHLWTSAGYRRSASDGGAHAVPCGLGLR